MLIWHDNSSRLNGWSPVYLLCELNNWLDLPQA